jgi:fatty acid desaturase
MVTPEKARLIELHQLRWSGTWTWMGFGVAFLLVEGLLLATLLGGADGPWQAAAVAGLVLVLSHLMHAHLIAFHEAAHGSLCPVRWLNDFFGLHVSPFNFLSLSLYRAAHRSHHAYLATERDEELWPFVVPGTRRWARLVAAFLELTFGMAYTPFLFLRAFLRPGTTIRERAVRRRIWLEQALIVGVHAATLAAVAWWGLWKYWLILYFLPAFLAGNMQSWRKSVEHMGLTGSGVLGTTRSIVAPGLPGRLLAFSLFNEPFHGVHHEYGGLPQGALPQLKSVLAPAAAGEPAPYPNYRRALWVMVQTLGDPHVGAQWLGDHGADGPADASLALDFRGVGKQ